MAHQPKGAEECSETDTGAGGVGQSVVEVAACTGEKGDFSVHQCQFDKH